MHPKKSLGQHFLASPQIAARIVETAELSAKDTVLEIGPGRGILTKELLKHSGRVIAIEKDERLIQPLQEQFAHEIKDGKLQLIAADALDFKPTDYKLQPTDYSVVANIPYYITGALLEHFLSAEPQPSRMVLLVQKEVAERIVAKDGKESILSVSVKAFGEPRYIKTVRAGSFIPPPKVDSAILAIGNISRKNFEHISEKAFFELVHLGFGQKRKMLLGNTKKKYRAEKVEHIWQQLGLDSHIRAEDVPIAVWLELSAQLKKAK